MPKPRPPARQDSAPRPPGKQPDRGALQEAALRHLARFAATEAGLLRVLDRRILRWQRASGETDDTTASSRAAAREVVQALVAAGALDDSSFAAARARRLVRAGRSRRAVSAHLAAKGVDAETASAALPDAEAEFLAAIAFVRRRRLGPFRPASVDPVDPMRELATIGRAGFPRDVAERALRLDPGEAAEKLAELKRGLMSDDRPRFSRAAILAGLRRSLPLQVGVVPFGLVVGILAQGQGLSLAEATFMSISVYAGSAQLLALGHWSVPAPIVAAATASFIVNLRLALMGPVIGPWLDRIKGWRLWVSLFLMADQNWALSVAEMQTGRSDAGFLFGSGILMYTVWVVSTALGHVVGGALQPPPGHPIFFAALAVFVSILVPMWHGKRDLLPWIMAATVALVIARLLPGTSWHIVGGAVAGAATGVIRDQRQ